ncbi:MAG: DNA mismatch repair protein MutS [Pseudomonadota bacterium]
MMAQYLEIKAQHPKALLFYRMGDFYELFFEDAEAAAAALDIALTKRGKHLGQDIAMCGVPHHAAESYLLTLIRKGFRVAIAEQMESPVEAKKRGYKAVVKRDVVRLVTPGTLTEDTLLDARRNNYLAAFADVRGEGALAWLDMSTGAFAVAPCDRVELGPMLARLTPKEVLMAEASLRDVVEEAGATLTVPASSGFDSTSAEKRLNALFGTKSLEGFGQFSRAELGAMGSVVAYVEITQKGRLPLIRPPLREAMGGTIRIDAATRRNLELTRALSGGRDGSLLAVMDETITGAGARLLETRLCAPSTDLEVIAERADAVAMFVEDRLLASDLRASLRRVPDMERALNRLALERGGPRDLAALREGLAAAAELSDRLQGDTLAVVASARRALVGHEALRDLLEEALVAEPPLLARDGGFVAPGYAEDLDEARKLRDEGRSVIAQMQAEYQALTEISSLKIKHNNVLGYFVEVTATHSAAMHDRADTFIHRQTTANQVRFTTVALSEMETKILNAGGAAQAAELRIFTELSAAVLAEADRLGEAARALAELDLAAGLAEVAVQGDWVRPQIDRSRRFDVTAGRHPVVEAALRREGKPFIANNCVLGDEAAQITLLTGPNMAGKSTYLRQNALIAVLAQMGSYVPAEVAQIGLVDQIFSRVGAADDLARGRSTFMVEMVETAAILNQAGDRALVILDEIGRGTATYDGLSIAWATLEHLHDVNRCRALFATHYHELTALSDRLPGLKNATVAVREWEGDVIFLHEVRPGAADRSYGVQVGRLAGLPPAVVERAKEVLTALEEGDRVEGSKAKALIDDLPLFSALPPVAPSAPAKGPSEVEERLRDVTPDTLSPREALDLLYELRGLVDE